MKYSRRQVAALRRQPQRKRGPGTSDRPGKMLSRSVDRAGTFPGI